VEKVGKYGYSLDGGPVHDPRVRSPKLRRDKGLENNWGNPILTQTFTHPRGGTLTITIESEGPGSWRMKDLAELQVTPFDGDET
jgi:hypothetical protein